MGLHSSRTQKRTGSKSSGFQCMLLTAERSSFQWNPVYVCACVTSQHSSRSSSNSHVSTDKWFLRWKFVLEEKRFRTPQRLFNQCQSSDRNSINWMALMARIVKFISWVKWSEFSRMLVDIQQLAEEKWIQLVTWVTKWIFWKSYFLFWIIMREFQDLLQAKHICKSYATRTLFCLWLTGFQW